MAETVVDAEQRCPICLTWVKPNPRYPRYLCHECATKAGSADGRALAFGNIGVGGGYVATYRDTGEVYPSHVCFVDDIECHADEARFGGIVIQTVLGIVAFR